MVNPREKEGPGSVIEMLSPTRTARLVPLAGALLASLLGGCERSTPQAKSTTAPSAATATVSGTATTAPPGTSATPRIVQLDPPNGAKEVDSQRTALAVTFDRPMDREGWSWVIEGPESAPELGEARFDAAARTNTVETRLLPGRAYVLWINSPRFSYFRSAEGVPSEPLRWAFTTRAATAAPDREPARRGTAATLVGPPFAVFLDPPNGATGVDPAKAVLRATFDRPMAASWSWVKEGSDFPEATGDAYFEPGARTAAMPVRLQPGRTYVLWLNAEQYQLFRDRQGIPARPLRWVFSTRAAG